MTRKTRPVAYATDDTATPRRKYEALTRSARADAYFMHPSGTWSAPDHTRLMSANWHVCPTGAPAGVRPVVMTYDRSAGREPWAAGDSTFRYMWDAMEAIADTMTR